MKTTCIILLFLAITLVTQAQQTPAPFRAGDRVVFVGNSITEGGHYHSYIWLYYMTRFPRQRMQMYSAGIGGDTSWDILNRIEEDAYAKKPTVLTLTFGMNDSGYYEYNSDNAQSFVNQRLQKVDSTFREIRKIMKAHPETRVILIGSSPYDETCEDEKTPPFKKKNETIRSIIRMQEETARENNWAFVDFNAPMLEINGQQQQKDPRFTLMQGDRIHPDNDGNMLMAYFFLKAQGLAGKPVAAIRIDAKDRKVKQQENCYISNLEVNLQGNLSFNYLAKALPYPLDTVPRGWGKKRSQAAAARYVPLIDDLNRETLCIQGLSGNYTLVIDGNKIADFTAIELEQGINMGELTNTPQYQQAVKIMHLNEARWEIEKRFREYAWTEFAILKPKGLLFADNQEALDSIRANLQHNIFLAGHLDNFTKAMHPEIRDAWTKEMDLLVDKIYSIAQPKVRKIEIIQNL
ncbi:SGNH/GDSL hydrolase family protein [Parabacteroides pacaensis]|uniref:SGNH/GDSL hydrolase family protein n=1 Tax=Parabacteroides pacaensis TaxID=2086575 RepID=UPI000D114796|nr:SGNH/GDSL hydrolase family protein [Parabacteroides pacaensis]